MQALVHGDDLRWCCSKHGLPWQCSLSPSPLYVLLVRNPYAWLESMHGHPYTGCGVSRNFSVFLRERFAAFGMCKAWRVRATPMAVWSEWHLAAIRLQAEAHAIIWRDEDFLNAGELSFDHIISE